ncbi:MAG: tetratricopeptide repeat protein [Verrucomicrobiota bacterium]
MIAKDKLAKILVCFALVLGTALLYAPVLHFDFVNYDDPLYILHNEHIRTFNDQFLVWCFQTGYAFIWHPLTWMSHLLDFQLYGIQHPGGHHATSVVLHIFSSVLLFLVLNRMTKALWRSAMVAALFAWHPLHVESVAWISERKDVLSAFFWMLTIWAYVRYVEGCKTPNAKCRTFYGLALFFFALGLMSKPMLVTLPFVLLLLDWWPLQRMQLAPLNLNPENVHGSTESSTSAEPTADRRPTESRATDNWRLLIEKIPFFVLSIITCFITLEAASRTMMPLARLPLLPRLLNALVIYFRYIKKMIWPQDMVIVYPFDYPMPAQEVLMAGLFLIVVSVIAIRLWKKRPFWLVGWFSYLGILVPVIGLVQVGTQPMADRYTYLSSIGIFMIVCWEAWDIATGWQHGRAILGTAAGVALGACCLVSSQQLQYWRNPYTLHLHSIAVMPNNAAAHADYAAFLRDDLRLEAARAECEKAIHLKTNYGYAHQVLGGVLFLEGKLDQADAELRTALRLDPGRLDVHMVMGQVAIARNSPVEAAAQYNIVLASEPFNPEAHCTLGQALAMQGRLEEAHAQYNEALRLAPQYAEAHHQMAVLLALQHQPAEAVLQYRMTLALQADRPNTMNNLAWILATDPHAEIRNGAEAVRFAAAACQLTRGQNPLMLGTLAAAYAENGKFDEAVTMAQQAHDLAVAQSKADIAARNLQLLDIYRLHQPYREKN